MTLVVISWAMSLMLAIPPLIGWGAYLPESAGIRSAELDSTYGCVQLCNGYVQRVLELLVQRIAVFWPSIGMIVYSSVLVL